MKIGFAHYSSSEDISGVTSWILDFCAYLKEAGHDVHIHLHHMGTDPSEASILKKLRLINVSHSSTPFTGRLIHDTTSTIKFLNSYRPDIFLPQCLYAHFFAAALAGNQGLPWIYTMHSDGPDYWCIPDGLKPETRNGLSVSVSHYIANKLSRLCNVSAPIVIPCGIQKPMGSSCHSNNPFRIVFSGRMVSNPKRIEKITETLIKACQKSDQIEGVLIGDGEERAACEAKIIAAQLSDRIKVLGRLEPADVPAVLASAQAILLMSDFEGLPLALMEGMAAGVVPVCREIESGIPELVHHGRTGLLVSDDPEQAAEALVRLSRDPVLWHRLSGNAKELVQSHFLAEPAYQRWTSVLENHQRSSQALFPISTAGMRRNLPVKDPRFEMQYEPQVSPLTNLLRRGHRKSRRLASQIKRRLLKA